MSLRGFVAACLAVVVLAAPLASAIYLPGVSPVDYKSDQAISMKVREMTSNHAPSYAYYKLPFCTPPEGVKDMSENLGEYLEGTTLENSPYQLVVLQNTTCNALCRKVYTHDEVEALVKKIELQFHLHWVLDNLPSAYGKPGQARYADGFPLGGNIQNPDGTTDPDSHFIYNHHHMNIQYHTTPLGHRIVGFYVQPVSVFHQYQPRQWKDDDEGRPVLTTCPLDTGLDTSTNPMIITGPDSTKEVSVVWSYDVIWLPSDIAWPLRWDVYLSMGNSVDTEIHWFAIINAFIITLFLSGMVAMILVRALYKDLSRYNRVATDEEKADDIEETGWKLVHADVFRPPAFRPQAFAVVIGVSTQLFGMAVFTILFAAIGFLSPANRGAVMIALVMLFLGMGIAAGYTSARTYKTFRGKNWQRTTLYTAFVFPALLFSLFFIMNLFVWGDGSSQAIPFVDMFIVIVLWLVISIPLVFVGAYYGFRQDAYKYPVSIGAVPRQIPAQPWHLQPAFACLVGGVLPFGAVFVEVVFILTSLWMSYYYYVFGFLLLVFIILVITCAEIAIVLTYFQLCGEDYRWWWRSYYVPGTTGAYLFLYSIAYYVQHLSMTFVAGLLYFGYMFIISLCFGMVCGCVGHYACFWFTRKIYGAIKVD